MIVCNPYHCENKTHNNNNDKILRYDMTYELHNKRLAP